MNETSENNNPENNSEFEVKQQTANGTGLRRAHQETRTATQPEITGRSNVLPVW